MAGPAQSKYKPKYCQLIIDHFKDVPRTTIEKREIAKDGKIKTYDVVVPGEMPTLEMFAYKIGVSDEALRRWREKYPEFNLAYIQAKRLEKNFLIQNAMAGIYNPMFSTFVAKNVTDMRDVVQAQHGFDEHALDQILALLPDEYAESVKKKMIEISEARTKYPKKQSKRKEPEDEV